MDSKTIKLNLKQAKEAIKNKDVESALQLCKEVLKQDCNNYLALVLLGAAFQESTQKDQAPNAYRKAIEVSPDQMLAWQGLANFYEKNDSDKHADQLVPVYQRLLHLESDTAKWCDIIFKMQSIITKFQSDGHVAEVLEAHKHTKDNSKQEALIKLVIHYLSHIDKVPEQYLKLVDEFLNSAPELEDAQYQVYLKVLYDLHKRKELLELGDKLLTKYGQNLNSCIAEWMCKVCAEQYVDSRAEVVGWADKLPLYYTGLLETDRDNVMAVLAQAMYHMTHSCYLEARDCLHHCLNLNKGLFHAICLLAESNLHLLCLEPAETLAQTASTLRPTHVFPKAVLAKTMSLMDSRDKWEQSVSLASEVLSEGPNQLAADALCQGHLQLQQFDQLEAVLSEHDVRLALAQLMRLRAQLTGDQLLSALSKQTPDCPEAWYQLGLLHLGNEQLDNACTAFLKCAKMAPHWYTAYLQLGHLYSKSPQTMDKARRCYQRALVLNPAHAPTMVSLSDTYRALGDGENNLELLKSVSQKGGGQWVWPRLGLQYSDLGDFTAAINCLRSALKSDPNNSNMWEALADAYLARGANGSALKSYQKALELNPGEFYPALQIATIKQMTDLPEEALQEFRDLVEKQPSSTMALKGLCETCLCLAKKLH